jgi:hypothetical protein
MKHLLTAWLPGNGRGAAPAPAVHQVLRFEVPSVDRWEPLPEDIAEWMGMAPYVAERSEERVAS